jgi:putative flippase GtrA
MKTGFDKCPAVFQYSLVRYVLAGFGISFFHYLIALYLAVHVLDSVVVSNSLAFCLMVNVSFLVHHKWTFSHKTISMSLFLKFYLVATMGFLASTIVLVGFEWYSVRWPSIELLVANAIVPFVIYLINRYWVFMRIED